MRTEDFYAVGKYNITLRLIRKYARNCFCVINIGSGGGLFSSMAQKAGYRVKSYEPDESAVELSRTIHPEVNVEAKGIEEIEEYEKNSIVVLHDVLEHIKDDRQTIELIARKIDSSSL